MEKLQRVQITLEIVTKAEEPLQLSQTELNSLSEEMETAVQSAVNLEYGNRYTPQYHKMLAVTVGDVIYP